MIAAARAHIIVMRGARPLPGTGRSRQARNRCRWSGRGKANGEAGDVPEADEGAVKGLQLGDVTLNGPDSQLDLVGGQDDGAGGDLVVHGGCSKRLQHVGETNGKHDYTL